MRQRAQMIMTTFTLLALLAGMGHYAAWATGATVALRELKRVDANGIPELVDATVTVRGIALQSTGMWHNSANYFAVISTEAEGQPRCGALVYLQGSTQPSVTAGDLVEVTGRVSVRGYSTDYGSTVISPRATEDIRVITPGRERIDALVGAPLPTDPTFEEAEVLESTLVTIEGRLTRYDNDGISRGFWVDGSRDGNIEDGVGAMQVKFYDYSGFDISHLRDGSYVIITGVLVQGDDTPPYDDSYYIRPTLQQYLNADETRARVFTAEELARQPMSLKQGKPEHLADKGIYQLTSVISGTSRPVAPGLYPDYRPDGSGLVMIIGKERSARTSQENSEANLFAVSFTSETQYQQLTFDKGLKARPRFAPDASRIVWAANANPDTGGFWNIYVIDIDGAEGSASAKPRAITSGSWSSTNPAWTRGSDRIVFQSDEMGSWDLVMAAPDGSSAPVFLTSGKADEAWPDWAPKADMIAYQSDELGNAFDIWVADVDGAELINRRCLTRSIRGDCAAPRWAPDGRRIAFMSSDSGSWDVWAVDVESGDTTRLTDLAGDEMYPAWSRDGRRVVFEADLGNGMNVYAVDFRKASGAHLAKEVERTAFEGSDAAKGVNLGRAIVSPSLMKPALVEQGAEFTVELALPEAWPVVAAEPSAVGISLVSRESEVVAECRDVRVCSNGLWHLTVAVPDTAATGLYDLIVAVRPASSTPLVLSGPHTVSVRNAGNDFTFAILSDIHLNNPKGAAGGDVPNARLMQAIAELNEMQPDFAVLLGDLVESTADTYARDYQMIQDIFAGHAEFPVFGVMGNHDGQVVGAVSGFEMWQSRFGPLYYSFDLGMWHFVVGNTYDHPAHPSDNGFVGAEQIRWIEADVAEAFARGQRIAAFVHHNPFDDRWVFVDEGRQALAQALSRGGARYVFAGHRHSDQLELLPTARIVTTRTVQAGSDDSEVGYRLVMVEQGRMEIAPPAPVGAGVSK